MLLQRLREYADQHSEVCPPAMYIEKEVSHEVALDEGGNPLGILPLAGGSGEVARGKRVLVPNRRRSGKTPPPNLLADTAEYALGWGRPDKSEAYHAAFCELVRDCAMATGEDSVHAVAKYLQRPAAERLPMPVGFDTSQIVTFSVDDQYPIRLPAVQRFWAEHAAMTAGTAECTVCGEMRQVVKYLPKPIKGVPGDRRGDKTLISTDKDAFASYGLKGMSCAPICVGCANAICDALNHLLHDETSHLYVDPLVYVFWTRKDSGFDPYALLSQPSQADVAGLYSSLQKGTVGALQIDPDRFFCAGMVGSGTRVAIRDWIDVSVTQAQAQLTRYFGLMKLVEPWGSDEERYFGLLRLARGTLRSTDSRRGQPNANVSRALMRCALLGGPLPMWMLVQVIKRIRAEPTIDPGPVSRNIARDLEHIRAALVKMVLASQEEGWFTSMAGLDEQNEQPAYLCGRLLAVLDQIQRTALGQRNATIIDRYFGTASTAPISVFPRLVRGAQPHIGKLRRDRPGAGIALEDRMQQIIGKLDGFPRTLAIHDQGLFILGYYHQRAADRRAASDRRDQADIESPANGQEG